MSASTLAPIVPAKVSMATFMGLAWGGVGFTAFFIIFRILVRMKAFGRLFIDDALVFLAWLMLLTNTILWQVGRVALYQNIAVSTGKLNPPPNFETETKRYLRNTVVIIIFFYSSLWAIKLSFLIFFKRLGQKVSRQRVLWWIVAVIVAASWFAVLGTIEYKCLLAYCVSYGSIRFQRLTLRYNMIIDVVTDALIILIPINLLWRVQISLRQKLALAGIFSLTVIIMIIAIVRVAVISSYSQEPDQTWLYMWSSIEQTVSITVACLASFRALFTKQDRSARLPDSEHNYGSTRKWLLFSRHRKLGSYEHKDTIALKNKAYPTHTVVSGKKPSESWHYDKPTPYSTESHAASKIV